MPISNIAIKGDGSEIVVGDAGRAEGDWRGSVAVYTRHSAAGPTRTPRTRNGSAPGPNHRFGWQVAYDQSNGDIYASGYKPAYGITTADAPDTADVDEEERGITETEYTIYHIDAATDPSDQNQPGKGPSRGPFLYPLPSTNTAGNKATGKLAVAQHIVPFVLLTLDRLSLRTEVPPSP